MHRTRRTALIATSTVALLVTAGQAQQRGRGGAPGAPAAPTGLLEALVAWVEEGRAPETLLATRRDQAGAITRSRPVCAYPLVATYKGRGSTDAAADFECGTGF